MILHKSFYRRPTARVARDLLGKVLVHRSPQGTSAGRIVEVEAYLPKKDPGCHAARGLTPRNAPMFGPPGHAYVYFCYGNHYLFNVVTEREGVPGAVLVRALEPLSGLPLMARRRHSRLAGKRDLVGLTNGPGKLVQALGMGRGQNRAPLFKGAVHLKDSGWKPSVGVTTRIGITEGWDLPLRFYVKGSPFLSVKPGSDRPSPGRKKAILNSKF